MEYMVKLVRDCNHGKRINKYKYLKNKHMKLKILLLSILTLVTFWISAQTSTPNISFEYDNDGNMEARYVVNIPSKSTEKTDSIAENTSIEELDAYSIPTGKQTITIYPNPTLGTITVAITDLDLRQSNLIRIFDASGRLLVYRVIQLEYENIDIVGPAGIYLMNIHLGDNISRWKIIKE